MTADPSTPPDCGARAADPAGELSPVEAATYAGWFACLAEPVRVRLLHTVASAAGPTTVGRLARLTGISQATCSHHLRKLADTGFVLLRRDGTTTRVTVNAACCTALPQAVDAVMGLLAPRPCCPDDAPDDVTVRPLEPRDWNAVRRIHTDGVVSGNATFETETPESDVLDATWLPGHRWVAERDGAVVGWTAVAPASCQTVHVGVGETWTFVAAGHRGRGVGRALIRRQVCAADDAGLWTLQASIFPENRAGLALHRSAGYRTVGVRDRIGRHHGFWRDTVLLERRRPADPP